MNTHLHYNQTLSSLLGLHRIVFQHETPEQPKTTPPQTTESQTLEDATQAKNAAAEKLKAAGATLEKGVEAAEPSPETEKQQAERAKKLIDSLGRNEQIEYGDDTINYHISVLTRLKPDEFKALGLGEAYRGLVAARYVEKYAGEMGRLDAAGGDEIADRLRKNYDDETQSKMNNDIGRREMSNAMIDQLQADGFLTTKDANTIRALSEAARVYEYQPVKIAGQEMNIWEVMRGSLNRWAHEGTLEANLSALTVYGKANQDTRHWKKDLSKLVAWAQEGTLDQKLAKLANR